MPSLAEDEIRVEHVSGNSNDVDSSVSFARVGAVEL